jgi:hypothetical protein
MDQIPTEQCTRVLYCVQPDPHGTMYFVVFHKIPTEQCTFLCFIRSPWNNVLCCVSSYPTEQCTLLSFYQIPHGTMFFVLFLPDFHGTMYFVLFLSDPHGTVYIVVFLQDFHGTIRLFHGNFHSSVQLIPLMYRKGRSIVDNIYVLSSNSLLEFLWALIVLLYWQTYSYIHMKQILFRNCYGIITKN